jgi:hypothetical protein
VLLVEDLNPESLDVRPEDVDVLIEQLEVLMLREVSEHLLEAKLKEEVSPAEGLNWVVLDE